MHQARNIDNCTILGKDALIQRKNQLALSFGCHLVLAARNLSHVTVSTLVCATFKTKVAKKGQALSVKRKLKIIEADATLTIYIYIVLSTEAH